VPRGGRPTGGAKGSDSRPERGRSGSAERGGNSARQRAAAEARGRPPARRPEPAERTEDQRIYDGPPIPDDVSAKDLDKQARLALRSLPEKLADRVARHLVMAGLLIESDPAAAYDHARAARARAQRSGLVREACGETAYAAGKFADALAEFRAARRLNGQRYYTPMMADCERALGRPEKALSYDDQLNWDALDEAGRVELTIVLAGARRDLGHVDAALRSLERAPLHVATPDPWLARLRYAYADALVAAGRRTEALEWFHRTLATDPQSSTDAAERIAELEA
jgi:tetratricopeptide (TPR) repeat protein